MELETVVIERISDQLIKPKDASLNDLLINDLGLDSLDFVDISMDLEKVLDIRISDEELWKWKDYSVRDLIRFLTKKILEKGGAK